MTKDDLSRKTNEFYTGWNDELPVRSIIKPISIVFGRAELDPLPREAFVAVIVASDLLRRVCCRLVNKGSTELCRSSGSQKTECNRQYQTLHKLTSCVP